MSQNEWNSGFECGLFVAVIAALLAGGLTWGGTRGAYRKEAVDRGYAQHVVMDEYGATEWRWMCDVPSDKGTE